MRTIREEFGLVKRAGEIGLEIEVEGERLPDASPGWKAVPDGSLRGGLEYVLKEPVSFDTLKKRLRGLNNSFNTANSNLHENSRTSVHVHLNVQEMSDVEVYTFLVVAFILEPFLMEKCGPSRKGNLFCLSSLEATGLIDRVAAAAEASDLHMLADERGLKYAAINVAPITSFGSVEFRGLRGTTDEKEILDWVTVLLQIKDASKKFSNPQEVIEKVSLLGPEEFTAQVLGVHRDFVLRSPNFPLDFYESVRNCQEIAYIKTWNVDVNPVFDKWRKKKGH